MKKNYSIDIAAVFVLDKTSPLDSSAYDIALEIYNECERFFNLNSFALYTDHIEIIEICSLPHALRNLTPIINLKYQYTDIKKYLKMKTIR